MKAWFEKIVIVQILPWVLLAVAGNPGQDTFALPLKSYDSELGAFTLHLPEDYPLEMEVHLSETTSDVALALVTRFGPVDPALFQLVVVSSREQLAEWVGAEMPKWIHAVAREHPSRVVVLAPSGAAADPAEYRFQQALLHELTHIYLYRLYPSWVGGPLPGWFHEGLAVHVSGGLDRGMYRALIRGRLTGRFYTLEQLDRIYHTSSVLSELAYAQSVVAGQVMKDFYGENVFTDFFNVLRLGLPFQQAFGSATGEPVELFYERYHAELLRRYNLLLVLADPAVLFILLPLLVVVAYFVRLWRNRIITARWRQEDAAHDYPNRTSPGGIHSDITEHNTGSEDL